MVELPGKIDALLSLFDSMDAELHDADCYVKRACCGYAEEVKNLYISLAKAEVDHYEKLRAETEKIIQGQRGDFSASGFDGRMYAWQMSHFDEHWTKTKAAIDNFGK